MPKASEKLVPAANSAWIWRSRSTVPQGSGPFPALLRMPDYGSVHDLIYTPLRSQAIVMNPTYRGEVVWNRSEWIKDHETGKRRRHERPESQWVRHRDEPLRIGGGDRQRHAPSET